MELDPTEKQLVFFAQECRLALLDRDFDTAEKFWNFIHPHLQMAFREMVKVYVLNAFDQKDIHQEATITVWKKIDRFDLTKAQNYKRPFTGWALDQGRYAIIERLRQMGLSRVMAHHKSAIVEKLTQLFPKGPETGKTWLELAKEHVQELASPPDLTEKMIQNTLSAWSLQDAEDVEKVDLASDDGACRFTREDFAMALETLDSRSRRFFLQKHVNGLSYAEIVKKYKLANPTLGEMKEDNARQIVSLACQRLRETLEAME
jgi:RNA polymerase sigma factor (sigma-70 family)